jgi:hypothetical protein
MGITWRKTSSQFKQTRTGESSVMIIYKATLKNEDDTFVFRDGKTAEVKWITKEELENQKIYENCLKALEKYFRLTIIY